MNSQGFASPDWVKMTRKAWPTAPQVRWVRRIWARGSVDSLTRSRWTQNVAKPGIVPITASEISGMVIRPKKTTTMMR